jgi:hypothetical protein
MKQDVNGIQEDKRIVMKTGVLASETSNDTNPIVLDAASSHENPCRC